MKAIKDNRGVTLVELVVSSAIFGLVAAAAITMLVFASQINGDGEIIVVTSESKFKKVIVSTIDPSKRYRKGSLIASLPDGESVICASYVTVPYQLAIVDKEGNISEISSEDIFISSGSTRAVKHSKYALKSIDKVFPMPYKKSEEE